MIRNVVFDLGNVLISFCPAEYLENKNYPPKIKNIILTDIFGSDEWILLDTGNITLTKAIDTISRKSTLKRAEIAFIFSKRTEIMFPIENRVRLLPKLKKRGFKLYYLSNFPSDIFDEVKNGYSFFKYFEGGTISADVKYTKPDIKIYNIFLDKYKIKPEESLYIDDIEINVRSAELTGMKGIHLSSSDSLEKIISELGLL